MALIKRKRKRNTIKAYVHDWLEPDQPGDERQSAPAKLSITVEKRSTESA